MRRHLHRVAAGLAAVLLAACASPGGTPTVAPAPAAAAPAPVAPADLSQLPRYRRVPAVKAALTLSGSSAAAAFARAWGSAFSRIYPGATVSVVSKSSGAAIADMSASPGTVGMTSRPLTAAERDAYARQHGRPPLEIKVAVDAVAIYVFKDNPLNAITLPQLERIYAAAPRQGEAIRRWGQAGATGEWAESPVAAVGFEAGRGAFELMRELVLRGGDFHADVAAEPVSTSVVQAVGVAPGAIGYASVTYRTARTKVLPVLTAAGTLASPTETDAASGAYPLARYLYLHLGVARDGALDAASHEFLRFVLSQEGQDVARANGAFAITPALAHEQVASLSR